MKIKKLQQTSLTNDKRIASGERFKKVGNLWTNESEKTVPDFETRGMFLLVVQRMFERSNVRSLTQHSNVPREHSCEEIDSASSG